MLPVKPANLEKALKSADEVLDSIAARLADELAPAIQRVWEDGISSIRADLREWLRREAESESGWNPHLFELSFGLAKGERRNADPASIPDPVVVLDILQLRGSIDLVERHTRGVLRATDHKTGKARAERGVVVGGGEVLQPILYALACEHLLSDPVESGRLYYCTAAGDFEERTISLNPETRATARTAIDVVNRALQGGFLPAAPAEQACAWCDYSSVCGPYEELRVKRKPKKELSDLEGLRGMQ
jgi:hypothetical protein